MNEKSTMSVDHNTFKTDTLSDIRQLEVVESESLPQRAREIFHKIINSDFPDDLESRGWDKISLVFLLADVINQAIDDKRPKNEELTKTAAGQLVFSDFEIELLQLVDEINNSPKLSSSKFINGLPSPLQGYFLKYESGDYVAVRDLGGQESEEVEAETGAAAEAIIKPEQPVTSKVEQLVITPAQDQELNQLYTGILEAEAEKSGNKRRGVVEKLGLLADTLLQSRPDLQAEYRRHLDLYQRAFGVDQLQTPIHEQDLVYTNPRVLILLLDVYARTLADEDDEVRNYFMAENRTAMIRRDATFVRAVSELQKLVSHQDSQNIRLEDIKRSLFLKTADEIKQAYEDEIKNRVVAKIEDQDQPPKRSIGQRLMRFLIGA
jgi:hypothetical protein